MLDPCAHIAAQLHVVCGRVMRLVGERTEEVVAIAKRCSVQLSYVICSLCEIESSVGESVIVVNGATQVGSWHCLPDQMSPMARCIGVPAYLLPQLTLPSPSCIIPRLVTSLLSTSGIVCGLLRAAQSKRLGQ
jgi:hypothetical protein